MRHTVRFLALAGSIALVIAACSPPPPVTVDGRVVGTYGAGVPGVDVVIEGHAATTTDAGGRFRVENVHPPYAVAVASTTDAWIHVFEGVTDPAPVLVPEVAQELTPTTLRRATLTGSLPSVLASDERAVVCAHATDPGARGGCAEIGAGDSGYALYPQWVGATEIDVTVRLVLYRVRIDGSADAILGVASQPRTVQDGAAVHDVLSPVAGASSTITPDTVVPFGFGPVEILIATIASGDASFQRVPFATGSPLAPVPVPTEPEMRYLVASWAQGADGARSVAWEVGLSAGASAQTVLLEPVTVRTPADGATGVGPSTVFRFDPTFDGTHTVIAQPVTRGAGPAFAVSTHGSEVTLPDPVQLDPALAALAWPSTEPYRWRVESFAENDAPVSVERAMEGRLAALDLGCRCGAEPATDGRFTRSATRDATTE